MILKFASGWEVLRSAVSRKEMAAIGKSYLLSWDSLYMSHVGCLGRLVVNGWTLEIYRPIPRKTAAAARA